MHVVWSWLRELVDLDQDLSAEEAAVAFTSAGLEVESLSAVGMDFRGVVVAQVVGKRKHPHADRLTLVDVIDQAGGTRTEVVCGAPNVPEPGGLVLWAPPGAALPGGLVMGKRAIKGVESAGMLCAEDELGLGDDHDGIIVLSEDDVLRGHGPLLGDAQALERLGLRDTVLEIGVPANRADALGHLGLARELAALVGGRLRSPAWLDALGALVDETLAAVELATVVIDDAGGCPRYVARIIDGLTVRPSPRWMRQRLRAVGTRPLSNLIDVTNYVMFELGQPLHAFDHEHVRQRHIQVRRARAGERMTTLDEVERALEPGDLLICDGERPVALAGVMGGANSEVSETTRRVLLESASFEPGAVRATARRLSLHSEASHRFERGVDPNLAELASVRAASLMARLGGGKVARGVVDAYVHRAEPWTVPVRVSRTNLLTGVAFTRDEARGYLERLDLAVADDPGDADRLVVTCPTYRQDLTREVDLIEEIIRVHGVHKVPATLPVTAAPMLRHRDDRAPRARRALVSAGLCEALLFGFTSQERIDALRLGPDDPRRRVVTLRNPMTVEQGVMRTSLLCNLLGAVARNLSFGIHDIALFEVGSVFWARGHGELPEEPVFVSGVLAGHRPGWLRDGGEVDFFDMKGVVERLLAELCGPEVAGVRFVAARDVPYLHPGIAASVIMPDGTVAGHLGEVHPETRAALGIEARCHAFELALSAFPLSGPRQMQEIPRFPAVTRDISIFVDEAVPAARVRDLIDSAGEPLIERVTVLEEFRDPAYVPAGKKGLLWSITYRSATGTLTDAQVDATHEALVARLVSTLPAQRR